MADRPHIVFLVVTFDDPAPRNIRAKQLIAYLSTDYRITVVCLQSTEKSTVIETREVEPVDDGPNTDVSAGINQSDPNQYNHKQQHRYQYIGVPYSAFSMFFTRRLYKGKHLNPVLLKVSQLGGFFLKRYLLFPDPFAKESSRLIKALTTLPEPPDVLVASVMPFSAGGIAVDYLAKLSGNKKPQLICDIGDPLARNALTSIKFSKERLSRFESSVVNASDHIIVTNEPTANFYAEKYRFDRSKIHCIPQGANLYSESLAHRKTITSGNIKLVYAGVFLEKIRDPRTLFKSLKNFRNQVHLTVFGGMNKKFIEDCEHITFKGWRPHSDVIDFYPEADCVVFFDNKEGIQTSGKIYELLATRKPILFIYGHPESAVMAETRMYGHIIFVANDATDLEHTFEKLEQKIIQARNWLDTDDGKKLNASGFSWRSRAMEFKQVLQSALTRTSGEK